MLTGSMAFLFVGFYDIGYFLKWVRNFLPVLQFLVRQATTSCSALETANLLLGEEGFTGVMTIYQCEKLLLLYKGGKFMKRNKNGKRQIITPSTFCFDKF
jgi:hypothetical protein